MQTQRNTWKPWQGHVVWERSFCGSLHPQEDDALFIVCAVKVISVDYRLEWALLWHPRDSVPTPSRPCGHQLRVHTKPWGTEPGPWPSYPSSMAWDPLPQPLPVWYWMEQIYTNIGLFCFLLHQSIMGNRMQRLQMQK